VSDPQSFDSFAEGYAFLAARERDHGFFLRHLPERRGRVLDLGCGSGLLARALARVFDEVVAIDVSEPMLALARRDHPASNLRYVRDDANALATPGPFDFIVSHTTFHHLADVPRTLAALRARLAPGGRIAVVDAVATRPAIPWWSFVPGAFRELPRDWARHGGRDARHLLRFRLSRPWLAHLASDRYLSAAEFRRIFAAALPGARFEPAGRFLAALWDAP
jgi:2-polyprenyl-3-methyl-5-hydroxy-6-metoxy-1,4-benzoquinol methylase